MASGTLQTWEVAEPFVHPHCGLGEGPYYEKAAGTVRFVDIANKRVHTVSLADGALSTIQLDVPVTVTADVEGYDPRDKILIGAKHGIALLDRAAGTYEYVARFAGPGEEDNARVRSNDGAVDPHGRFWLGSMTDFGLGAFRPEGGLWRFDGRAPGRLFKSDITIPNSVSWSPDGRTMYFTHSNKKVIHAYDYAAADGAVSNERVFYQHGGTGEPDGHRIDAEGNLWTAFYGESCVLKISPRGEVVGKVSLPTRNITCCEFVGTELFITSAADDEGDDGSRANGGAVYRVDVGVTGVPPNVFKLGA